MKTSDSKRIAHVAILGFCEHCGVLLIIQDMSCDSMDVEWCCPKCKKVINSKTFGWKDAQKDQWKKIHWAGKEGEWID